MSKIHNHIVINQDIKSEYSQGIQVGLQCKKDAKVQQKVVAADRPTNASTSSVNHQSHETLNTGKEEDQNFRFSRFQPWHLTQMVQNTKVDRQTEENRGSAEKNLQQFNSESQEQEFYFFTPVKPETYGFADKKTGVVSSAKKKNYVVNTIPEKRIRPKQKGLRKLSGKAFQIVKDLGQATYKQVALRLIKQIQDDQSDIDDEREENNIKRRVYDALNVLIAMGILQKKGRNIVYQLDSKVAQEQQNNIIFKQAKQNMLLQLKQKADALNKKKEQLKQLQTKIKIFSQIISSNLVSNRPIQERIQIPFVCLQVPFDSVKSIKLENSKSEFKIAAGNNYQFFGDLDFLLKRHTSKKA